MDAAIWVAIISFIVGPIVGYLLKRRELIDAKNTNTQLRAELANVKKALSLPPMLSHEEYGIEIDVPVEYANVGQSFRVTGTYKDLPEGQVIWVSTFGVFEVDEHSDGRKKKRYWPQEPATLTFTAEGKKWHSLVHNIGGGTSAEAKEFLVLVVGIEGQALFKYYQDAGASNKQWTPIGQLTTDVVECATGKVTFTP